MKAVIKAVDTVYGERKAALVTEVSRARIG